MKPTLSAVLMGLLALGAGSLASADITPAKTWFAPFQPLSFTNDGDADVQLVLRDFLGKPIGGGDAQAQRLKAGQSADLRKLFPEIGVGTYLLYATKPEGDPGDFIGTPWVIGIRGEARPGSAPEPMVIKVEPLRYAVFETDKGNMTAGFYYDVAPNTVDNFLRLAEGGFFDGLSFHRIVPGFVIQGGDPKNDTTGGPGYTINAEFNDRPHIAGALSMAREGDPIERQGAMPRYEAANSAGCQFFIALDYKATKRLDGRYAVFGRVVDGLDVVQAIGTVEIANPANGQPRQPQVIRRVRVERVTAAANPYTKLFEVPEEPQARPG